MSNYPSPLITDRWADYERRLARLEALLGSGISGTDQTIKGSHDRLDALLGAAGASANLVNGVSIGTYAMHATITKSGIVDNTPTAIFTVTTTNEDGSNDGGGFTCKVETLVGHGIASDAANLAIEWNYSVFQRINKADGTDYSALGEIYEGASTASASATRDIGATTPSIAGTSDYVTTFSIQTDLTGSGVGDAQVVCFVTLLWWGYQHAPVIAAA